MIDGVTDKGGRAEPEAPDTEEITTEEEPKQKVAVLRFTRFQLEILTKLTSAGVEPTVRTLNDVSAAHEVSEILKFGFSQFPEQ